MTEWLNSALTVATVPPILQQGRYGSVSLAHPANFFHHSLARCSFFSLNPVVPCPR